MKQFPNYNLLLLANDTYFKLLNICVKSILSECDLNNINKIYIADLGLRKEYKVILAKQNDKIEILDTDTCTGDSKELYSEDWIEAVSQKTAILLKLVQENLSPIIMLDSDTIILKDFSDVIDHNYDIQVCKRAFPLRRKDGLILDYIASFFIVNNINAESFIITWINRLSERISLKMLPPHETPAMTETIQQNTKLKIGFLDENEISCENNNINGHTKIIHAKSRNPNDSVSIYRLANIKRLPYIRTITLLDSKVEKILFTFVFVIKKLFPIYNTKQKIKQLLKKK